MGDNISRQGLLLQIEKDADGSPGWYGDTWQFIKTIKSMPSTDRTGHWILQDTSYWRATPAGDVPVNRVNLKCSCCGYRLHYTKIARKYCPECGADMRGEEE